MLVPYASPSDRAFTSLVSRSADAEINARVHQPVPAFDVIRGSGGRESSRTDTARKGGVKALIVDAQRAPGRMSTL
jgi:lysophospholipid acyltransferase (LPLAT)-like uncharacterized protein